MNTTRQKSVLALLLAILLAAALLPGLRVSAEDKTTGTFTLKLPSETAEGYEESLPSVKETGVTGALYKVAGVTVTNGKYIYTAADGFGDLKVENTDSTAAKTQVGVADFADINDETAQALADAAKELVTAEDSTFTADATVTIAANANEGTAVKANSTSKDLDIGLYLLVVKDFEAGEYSVTANAILISVPYTVKNEDKSFHTEYDVEATLKYEANTGKTAIKIIKNLPAYSTLQGSTTFVFEVVATKDDKTVFSNVYGLNYNENSPAAQSVIVENLPTGADITVTEIYSGTTYTAEGNSTVKLEAKNVNLVKAEDLETAAASDKNVVTFTNGYTPKNKYGAGVINKFKKTDDGSWNVTQDYSTDGND